MVYVPPRTIPNHTESPIFLVILNFINVITNMFLGAVAISAFVFANNLPKKLIGELETHIYLCVTGYVIFLVQAVHSLDLYTGWARAFSYNTKRTIHYILQIIGSILVIAGSTLKIARTDSKKISAHGIFGIIAMLLTFAALIGGVANLFARNMTISKKCLRIFHSLLGCLTICTAFITLMLAFNDSYRKSSGDRNANSLIALTAISLMGTILSPILSIQRTLA